MILGGYGGGEGLGGTTGLSVCCINDLFQLR